MSCSFLRSLEQGRSLGPIMVMAADTAVAVAIAVATDLAAATEAAVAPEVAAGMAM